MSACWSAIGVSLPALQESPGQVRDQVGLLVESEVAGVQDVHLGAWHVPAVCVGLLDLERGVVAAPYDLQGRLAFAEPVLPGGVARQYDLVSRARELGWPGTAVTVIDEDLGLSGASAAGRAGFAELAARVGMGQVGIVLSLEVSRLARNNADWYRLLDLAGMTDTLIADADGIYHPAVHENRLGAVDRDWRD